MKTEEIKKEVEEEDEEELKEDKEVNKVKMLVNLKLMKINKPKNNYEIFNLILIF